MPEETPTENAVPQYVGELALEGFELGTHREGALAGDLADDFEQLLQEDGIRLVEAGHRDGHEPGLRINGAHAATFPAIVGAQSISESAVRRAPRPR